MTVTESSSGSDDSGTSAAVESGSGEDGSVVGRALQSVVEGGGTTQLALAVSVAVPDEVPLLAFD